MGEGRPESSPVHQDEDAPSIARDMFLDQRTGSYLLGCSNRRVELRCGARIVDRAPSPPLPADPDPRDAGFDHRWEADMPDRALDVGRTTHDDGLRNGDPLFRGERHQGALVVGGLHGLEVRERQRNEPLEL